MCSKNSKNIGEIFKIIKDIKKTASIEQLQKCELLESRVHMLIGCCIEENNQS